MIELIDVSVKAGKFELRDINMTIPTNKYGMLVGKTGSGKTTILEAICGLKKVTKGKILINGTDATYLRPAERGIGFVPQDGALFETKTVFENIAFSLRLRKWSKTQIGERVQELSKFLKIENILTRSTHFLSGGERQRVSLARALAFSPSVLCLDEPLSALDPETHREICTLLKNIQNITGATILHITHNQNEIRTLADLCYQIREHAVILTDVHQLITEKEVK